MMEHFHHNGKINEASNYDGDGLDFPCAPCWVHGYAQQGLTQDYPPELYFPNVSALEQRIEELEKEVDQLKGKRIIFKFIQPIRPTPKSKGFQVEQ